jgi:hypothetical protein
VSREPAEREEKLHTEVSTHLHRGSAKWVTPLLEVGFCSLGPFSEAPVANS